MARDVPSYSLRTFLHALSLRGVDVDRLTEGLSFTRLEAAQPGFSADWDECCILYERIEREVDEATLRASFLDFGSSQPEVRMAAQALLSTKALFEFTFQSTRILWPLLNMTRRYEGHVMDWRITLPLHRRGNRLIFRGTGHALEAMPRHLGLPDAKVEMDVGSHHGFYRVHLPESQTILASARKTFRSLWKVLSLEYEAFARVAIDEEVTPIPTSSEQTLPDSSGVGEFDQKLSSAARAWTLTNRQVDVLRHVIDGETNKSIASKLGCAEGTVEFHMTALLKKSCSESRTQLVARFWCL